MFDRSAFMQTLTYALPSANVRDNTKTPEQRAAYLAASRADKLQQKPIVPFVSGALYNNRTGK